jgi:tetratricopeptide (TPR) repeat protein
MYNIKILEDEWKKYNRKKKRPWIVAGILSFIVLLGGALIYSRPSLIESLFHKQTISKSDKPDHTAPPKVFVDSDIVTPAQKEKKHFSQDIPLGSEAGETEVQESQNTTSGNRDKGFHIEVVEAGNHDAYREVEKRFRLGHDIDDSLFLAKAYYLKGNYKKAEYWALQTNKINDNIEESWLIFAKAKVKRGQNNEAVRILDAYIKRSNSIEAKALLEKIKKGAI